MGLGTFIQKGKSVDKEYLSLNETAWIIIVLNLVVVSNQHSMMTEHMVFTLERVIFQTSPNNCFEFGGRVPCYLYLGHILYL